MNMRLFFALLLSLATFAPAMAADFRSLAGDTLKAHPLMPDFRFNDQVALSISDHDDFVTSVEAEQKLDAFIATGEDWRYAVIHKGEIPTGGTYTIGLLKSSAATYRVTVTGQYIAAQMVIDRITIEAE
jgi:hypothetical protein